jgi:hypothetical protein
VRPASGSSPLHRAGSATLRVALTVAITNGLCAEIRAAACPSRSADLRYGRADVQLRFALNIFERWTRCSTPVMQRHDPVLQSDIAEWKLSTMLATAWLDVVARARGKFDG